MALSEEDLAEFLSTVDAYDIGELEAPSRRFWVMWSRALVEEIRQQREVIRAAPGSNGGCEDCFDRTQLTNRAMRELSEDSGDGPSVTLSKHVFQTISTLLPPHVAKAAWDSVSSEG